MKKQVFGRKFKRDKNERKALFSGLISSVIVKGRISTTLEKAKAIQPDLEKLVTKAKKGESARIELTKSLKPFEIDKLINDIAPVFKDRNGGYTRIIKTGKRFNDNASTAIIEWVDSGAILAKEEEKKAAKKVIKKESKKSKVKPSGKSLKIIKGKEKPSSRKATKA